MNYTSVLLFTLLSLTSCGNDKNDELVLDTTWLDQWIAETLQSSIADYSYILQAKYDKETVFIFGNCCPICASLPSQVHSVDGSFIGYLGIEINTKEVTGETVYWQTENGQCAFISN